MTDVEIAPPHRRGVTFDLTIRLDMVIGIIVALASVLSAYVSLQSQVGQHTTELARIERQGNEADARIERVFMAKINDQRALVDQVNLTTAENIREIKGLLSKIDDKLDRKADKPGR
jgi:hypothetical protein